MRVLKSIRSRYRLLAYIWVLMSAACAHTGQRTVCTRLPGGPNAPVACRTIDYDEQNRQSAARERLIKLNACVEGRQRTNPNEPFTEAQQRCDMAVSAQVAASEQAAQ